MSQCEYRTDAPFCRHNRKLIEEIEALEHKSRRRDVLVDEERSTASTTSASRMGCTAARPSRTGVQQAEKEDPNLLFLAREYLMRHGAEGITEELFPARSPWTGSTFPLDYRFEPGHPMDGVTMNVPLAP